MKNCELTITIPAYMEEENLRILLPRLKKVLSAAKLSYEINIIDTMTPLDRTMEVSKEHGAQYFNREGSNSYGDAIRTAIKNARGTYTIFMDGDGSHSPEFIPTLLEDREAYDVVIASRYVRGGISDNSLALILMSKVVNIVYSLVLNLQCQDVSNSFKLYHTEMLKKLSLYSHNFDIIEEILFKLKKMKKNKFRIKEIPYTFKKRIFGHTKRNLFLFAFSYLFSLIKLRLRS